MNFEATKSHKNFHHCLLQRATLRNSLLAPIANRLGQKEGREQIVK
jgi:hypothetical protein